MKLHQQLLLALMLLPSFSFSETVKTDFSVSSTIEPSCVIDLPDIFNFGILEFSTPATATVIPANYAAFKEMPFPLKVKCSSQTAIQINYLTERDLSPSGIEIEGIKMKNPNSINDLDRFNAYIFNTETQTMLHSLKKPLFRTGTGDWIIFNNLYIAIQNPLSRGYMSPIAGVYSGTSELKVDF